MKAAFFVLGIVSYVNSGADAIRPFTTDICSGFPDGNFEDKSLWMHCCIEHDMAYWKGGTYDERVEADEELGTCVQEAGAPLIGEFMMKGVRVFGSPVFPTTYRWGYGWPYRGRYRALSEDEENEVDAAKNEFVEFIQAVARAL